VIARIPGSEFPDEWIIRGNHHDGWVYGAADPVSAVDALLEEARGFSEILKQGWKPRRTIVYCVWDGEEQGLLGSTEWAEALATRLGVTDGSGPGPDVGSAEWRQAVERKLAGPAADRGNAPTR